MSTIAQSRPLLRYFLGAKSIYRLGALKHFVQPVQVVIIERRTLFEKDVIKIWVSNPL